MPKVLVLGAGRVGTAIAADLAADFEVTVSDRSRAALDAVAARCGGGLATVAADLSDAQRVRELAGAHDVVVGALASHLGLGALEAVITAGRPYCDISFMEEDPRVLDGRARDAGVTAVVDCGVAPGLSHMLSARSVAELDRADSLKIYVGGVPRERRWPFEYKAGFAPRDVVAEYTRPVRYRQAGRVVTCPALEGRERIDVAGVGTMEAFLTDGLRSLVDTLDVPDCVEKTLRYPGHAELMAVFREAGLFGEEPVEVAGVRVRPVDLFSELVFPQWSYGPGEVDLTVMKVVVEGQRGGEAVRITWDLFDEYDETSGLTSMARTTAYPCTAVTRLLAAGRFEHPGVVPPEVVAGDDAAFEEVIEAQRARGVRLERGEEAAGGRS